MKHRFTIAMLGLYIAAHIGLLWAPESVYWDDWVLYQTSPDTVLAMFREAGSPFVWTGHLHNLLMLAGPWVYKVLTFFLFLASAFRLDTVLRSFPELNKAQRFIIVSLFALLPFNMARIASINLPYALNTFLFFTAWSFLQTRPKVAASLFFVSFNTNSLLMFYALPMLDLFSKSGAKLNLRSIYEFAKRYVLFLGIPFLYFAIKTTFFKPSGVYAGYKEGFSLRAIPYSIWNQLQDLRQLQLNWILVAILFPILFTMTFLMIREFKTEITRKKALALFGLGFLALFLGLFPYWILKLTPTFYDWTARHQLLMPLGTSLILSSLIFVIPRKFAVGLFSLLTAASIAYCAQTYVDFYVDWKKQQSLIEAFKASPEVRAASVLVFDDQSKNLNAIQREYRFYEWNALMVAAFGDESRFGIAPVDLESYYGGRFDPYFSLHGKAANHVRDNTRPPRSFKIQMTPKAPGFLNRLQPQMQLEPTTP